jgi:hypothetical protein
MPDPTRVVVINTTPLIALTAATGTLDLLRTLFARVKEDNNNFMDVPKSSPVSSIRIHRFLITAQMIDCFALERSNTPWPDLRCEETKATEQRIRLTRWAR